jgi:hypothetical protein
MITWIFWQTHIDEVLVHAYVTGGGVCPWLNFDPKRCWFYSHTVANLAFDLLASSILVVSLCYVPGCNRMLAACSNYPMW